MGLIESFETQRKTYLSIVGKHFSKKTTKDDPRAIKRVNKNGTEVYEILSEGISGKIVYFEVVDSDYGRQLEITIQDGDDSFILSMGALNSHALRFYNYMENINYMEEVVFVIWDLDNPLFGVQQRGESGKLETVAKKYDKEQIPKWEKKEVNGSIVWDKTEVYKFFVPKIQQVQRDLVVNANTPKSKAVGSGNIVDTSVDADSNDLPF